MELIKEDIKVEWVELGEGFSGEYDPNNPDDMELLRFYVSKCHENEWIDLSDASYCTLFPANTEKELKKRGLQYIMNKIFIPASKGESIKKICEELSWLDTKIIKGV